MRHSRIKLPLVSRKKYDDTVNLYCRLSLASVDDFFEIRRLGKNNLSLELQCDGLKANNKDLHNDNVIFARRLLIFKYLGMPFMLFTGVGLGALFYG